MMCLPMVRWLLPLLLILLNGLSFAATPQLQSWTTRNGAKVIFVEADALPMLDIRVVFDAGSARDGELAGLAAFTNAMLTEGAGEWDADALAARLENRGIDMGSGSLRDMAWVSVRTLTEQPTREVAISTLAAVLSAPRFDADAIARVREQMLVARRQLLQKPGGIAAERFYRTLYGDHPYAHPPGGTERSLQRIGRAQLQDFHRRYYVGANAVIAMVGAVDRKTAEQIAEQVTAGLPKGRHAPDLPEPKPVKGGELRQVFPSSQTHILIGQLGIRRGDPDYFPLYVGNHVLGGSSLVSILGNEVRNKRGLSYSVYSYFSAMRATGPFVMAAQTRNDKADETLRVMRQTLRDFVQQGPGKEALDAAKKNLVGGFPLQIANNGKIAQYIAMIGFYGLPLDWLEQVPRQIEAVTLADVRDAFLRRIDPDRNITVVVGGKPK